MIRFKSFFYLFFQSIALIALVACTPEATEKKALCGTDQAFNTKTRACYSITPGNKAPVANNFTVSALNPSFAEDTQSIITLSYTDTDLDKADACEIKSVSHVSVTQACSCTVGGVCTVEVQGDSNYYGSASFTYAVRTTDGKVSNTATANLSITDFYDDPTISAISAQSTNEDTNKSVSFTISDVDSTLTCNGNVSVTGNDNPGILSSVTISGTYPNCIATFIPVADDNGVSNMIFEVTDDTSLTASSTFAFTINAVNDAPTITFISHPSTIAEDSGTTVASFTIADSESTLDCTGTYLSVSATNALLIPVPATDIVFGGVYPNCTATITPAANQSGTSNMTITVSDGTVSTTSNTFITTVTAVNDTPTISAIADTSTSEDASSTISFSISDVDHTLDCASASASSSVSVSFNSNPTVIPTNNIVFTEDDDLDCFATITPASAQNGSSTIEFMVSDANSASSTVSFVYTVIADDDDPTFASPTSNYTATTNEGGAVQTNAFVVDEDDVNSSGEDSQGITITDIDSDNTSLLPLSGITAFYDLNDNGVEDTGEARDVGAVGVGDILESSADDDVRDHNLYFKLDPVDGESGVANITLTISDGINTAEKSFSFVVNPVAALHGGWSNISAVGIKTDKSGDPVVESEKVCQYDTNKCNSGGSCSGTSAPNGSVTPASANVLYYDTSAKRCYRSTGTTAFTWTEIKTTCPISKKTSLASCTDTNCIGSSAPSITPTAKDQYFLDSSSNTCWVSYDENDDGFDDADDWQEFSPSKITLSWNSFTMSGSGVDSSAYIIGYNVYRREANEDFDFKTGFLKATSSATMTVSDSNTLSFTDTTAIAGKVYYYVVRPVDSEHELSTYTPEIYSEVRVVAPPANYAFVHRWMMNQEICNGMNMTTSTTAPNRVDPANNYRCPYIGPGDDGSGYYDIGQDMLVDLQEMGCPYSKAPTCGVNGCVGMGAPSSSPANGSIYYDRSSGSCYLREGGSWVSMNVATLLSATTFNTALNPPLVNVSATQAAAVCSARTSPTISGLTGVLTPALPEKKEFMAYSAPPKNLLDNDISDLEEGFSLNVQSRCNGSSASGIESAYTDSTIPSSSFIYSIPGTASSGIKSLYTGSIPWVSNKSTESCVSRYGIQDLYGNVKEWVRDMMICDDADGNFICNSISGISGPTALYTDMDSTMSNDYYGFDFTTGPFNDASADSAASNDDDYLTEWSFYEELFNAGKFSFPLALPISNDFNSSWSAYNYLLDIGAGISINKLHDDGVIVNAESIVTDGGGVPTNANMAVGGSYLSGAKSGRFTSELIKQDDSDVDVGFRCVVPVATGNYPVDSASEYNYTY